MICIQQPTSPPGQGVVPLRAASPRLPHNNSVFNTPSALALTSTAVAAIGLPQQPLQLHMPLPLPSSSMSQLNQPTPIRSSRAERSLLNVLERERRGRDRANSSSGPAPPIPAASPPPPSSTPSPPSAALSPPSSRAPSRAPSRGPSRSASPVPAIREAFGFGFTDRELDLASLVERSIALQSSSPAATPPSSPPRPTRRPHFSTSPSLAAAHSIPEATESDTEGNTSASSVTTTLRAYRKRAATLTTLNTQGSPLRAGGLPLAAAGPGHSPTASTSSIRPSVGPRTRSNPMPSSASGSMAPIAAPVPRRAAVASMAAASLLPNANALTGLTHLPPSVRDHAPGYTPSNTLALRGTQRTTPGVQGILLSPEPRSSPMAPYSYPGAAGGAGAGPNPALYSPAAHHLRPAMSISSVASAASAQSAASDSRVPVTPSGTPPQMSPLNPRPPSRRDNPKRNSPRPISGPFLAPAGAESDIPFDVDRAARRLRNAPGRVCFDDVALFPPSDDADDEDDEDSARKRPRMGRRWSLW